MSLKLYWNLGSQPSRAIKSLLVAGGVPHEDVHLDLFKRENRNPEILAINPSGVLPFVVINDDIVLEESAAILRFLAQ